ARPQDAEGRIRPRRFGRPAAPDPPDGGHERDARHAARGRPHQEAAGRSQYRRDDHQAPGSDYRLDDQIGAQEPEGAQWLAATPYRCRLRHDRTGRQSPLETVSGHVRDDEEDEEAWPKGPDAAWAVGADAPGLPTLKDVLL